MYLIWFDCCGLVVSAIILISFYTRNRIPIVQDKAFSCQVWCVIATTVCNLILGIMQNGAHPGMDSNSLLLMNLAAFIYHTLRMVSVCLYAFYILSVLNLAEKSVSQFLYLYLPAAIAILVCFAGASCGLVFSIDSSGIHHFGPLMPLLYLTALHYMFLTVYVILYFRRIIPLAMRLVFHSIGIIVIGTTFAERMFPTIMVEGFGSVMCLLLIYLTLQKPEEVVDGTTGLLNKSSFVRMISIRIRQKAPFDLIVIRIDNFEFLKKFLGLRVMGTLMRSAGSYLRNVTPKATSCRVSDSAFCVMLNNSSPEYVQNLMEKIQARSQSPWEADGQNINLDAYFSLFQFSDGIQSVEEVLDLLGMAAPEVRGRNEMGIEGASELRVQKVERMLKEALQNKGFEVVYQPVYSVSDQSFYSAEALLRLNDNSLGPVGPDEFIPIAEKSGLIVKIGQFVLEEVCCFIAGNGLEELGIDSIEVNLSIVECLQDDMAERVLSTLKEYQVETRKINFEITEKALEKLPETVIRNITRLAEKGLRFSLDDYGTGYSNIGRILALPLDSIKLDKTVIETYFASESPNVDAIMKETLHILNNLGKIVVAEGVETGEQAQRLIKIGCEYLQGYYYAKPLSAKAFVKKFRREPGM